MKTRGNHFRKGGKIHQWNPEAPEVGEAEDESDGFKRGGKAHKMCGKKFGGRLDKKARGGQVKLASGGKVMSEAANIKNGKGVSYDHKLDKEDD